MRIRYGNYLHDDSECSLSVNATSERDQTSGRRTSIKESWSISGVIHGTDAADLTAKLDALKAAYSQDNQDIVLLDNDGNPTTHQIISSQTKGGVKVQSFNFPTSEGAEYTTYRSYAITVEAEKFGQENPFNVIAFTETVRFSGGGPRIIHRNSLFGLPQRQVPVQNTPYRAVQSGQIVGEFGYPNPPNPISPGDLIETPEIEEEAPVFNGERFTKFVRKWNYVMESPYPIIGQPNRIAI